MQVLTEVAALAVAFVAGVFLANKVKAKLVEWYEKVRAKLPF